MGLEPVLFRERVHRLTVYTLFEDTSIDPQQLVLLGALILGALYVSWITYLLVRRRKYVLVIQTNAGGAPRLLTTHNEQFLDRLIYEASHRSDTSQTLIANIRDNIIVSGGELIMGDQVKGDKFMSEQIMGDQFHVSGGQIGAIGPGAHAHDINFNQQWNELGSEINLRELEPELAQVREAMKNEATENEHYQALAEVSSAEEAARSDDGPKVLEHLRSAGTWALDAATKTGSKLAVEAIKHSMGM